MKLDKLLFALGAAGVLAFVASAFTALVIGYTYLISASTLCGPAA